MRENPEQDSDYYAGPRTKLVCSKCGEKEQERIVKIPYHNHYAIPERRPPVIVEKMMNYYLKSTTTTPEAETANGKDGNKISEVVVGGGDVVDKGYYRIWCKTCGHGKDQTEMIWMKLDK